VREKVSSQVTPRIQEKSMNKTGRLMSSILLALATCALAAAQDAAPPLKRPAPPSFCKPCLWYSGDFNPYNSKANGASNEMDIVASQSVVSVPFTVPKGKIWKITGAFGVVISQIAVIDPPQANWSFSKDVSTGKAGKLIKSGASAATVNLLGCNGVFEFYCLGVLVKELNVTLTAGRYWLTVVPNCDNPNDSQCGLARYFLADVEDNPPLNHFGPKNVRDASYFTSKQFDSFYAPTWGSSGTCSGDGCDVFSAGLLGTSKVDQDSASQ
jgi:hypothetical protein